MLFRKGFLQIFSFQRFYAYEDNHDKLSYIPFFLTANWKGFVSCSKDVIVDGGGIPVAFTKVEQIVTPNCNEETCRILMITLKHSSFKQKNHLDCGRSHVTSPLF